MVLGCDTVQSRLYGEFDGVYQPLLYYSIIIISMFSWFLSIVSNSTCICL